MNKYLRAVLEYTKHPLPGPTVIWKDNQPAIDTMLAGQITGRVKHMAVPIAMIQEDIRQGTSIPKKTSGILNPSDMRTKPNPASTLHHKFQLARSHKLWPPPTSEHGKLIEVELINQRLTEFDLAAPNSKFNYKEMSNVTAVYNTKDPSSQKSRLHSYYISFHMHILLY